MLRKYALILFLILPCLNSFSQTSAHYNQRAKEYLSKKGYDTTYGARPLKRLIQTEIMNELARMIIENKIKEGNKIKIDSKNDKLIFEIA